MLMPSTAVQSKASSRTCLQLALASVNEYRPAFEGLNPTPLKYMVPLSKNYRPNKGRPDVQWGKQCDRQKCHFSMKMKTQRHRCCQSGAPSTQSEMRDLLTELWVFSNNGSLSDIRTHPLCHLLGRRRQSCHHRLAARLPLQWLGRGPSPPRRPNCLRDCPPSCCLHQGTPGANELAEDQCQLRERGSLLEATRPPERGSLLEATRSPQRRCLRRCL